MSTPPSQPIATGLEVKIALATSSRLMRVYIGQTLKAIGVKWIDIDQGPEVFARVKKEHPQILLLQMDMEGVDLGQIKRLIREQAETRQIFVVALSTTVESEAEAYRAGADGFIEFPFETAKVLALIEKSQNRQKRIMLIDDSKVIHEYIKKILRDEPYQMIHAYSGEEAQDTLAKITPDLVITDLEMPGISGYEICSWIKNHERLGGVPVIISSTLSQGYEIDRGFDAGADDYLVKPVDGDELVNKLHKMLLSPLKQQREEILIVDDSRVILSLLSNGLENQGFRVVTANQGEQALELAKSMQPSLVITDCEMPGLNGRDLARALRNILDFRHLPIIMLTARDEAIEKAKARKAGVSEFITKPFTIDKILVIVERLIAEARMQREREAMASYMSEAALKQATDRARNRSSNMMTAYRDHAAVLFTDVSGFTSMSESMAPHDIISMLNHYFDEMVQIIKSNGGIIDKFIGDAIMATFYGKTPADNALNAVRAGLGMIEKLKEKNSQAADPSQQIHIRVGINSGDVIFGDLGSRMSRRDFTVIGDNVNTAQRLESKAPIDHVLISDSTFQLVHNFVIIEKSEHLQLKGKAKRLLCHVLAGLKPQEGENQTIESAS